MATRRAVLKVISGPNEGDTVSVEVGSCRLIGRHLSESETALIDRDGNRVLDGTAVEIIQKHLKNKAPVATATKAAESFSSSTFDRGSDIVFSDDAISRAHAMVFYDESGVGIIDLASTNGTFVNQERVASALITDGDTLTLGSSDLSVHVR